MAQLPETKRLQQLARKFLQGTISYAEQQELDDWFQSQQALNENPKPIDLSEDAHRKLIFARIQDQIQKPRQQNIRALWPRIVAAASILIFLSVGGYFLLHRQKPIPQLAQNQKQDIVPGQKQVTLTLANGQTIAVNNKIQGKLAQQGNMVVQVNNGNALTYSPAVKDASEELQYNTLSTARGEESPFPLMLSDGTKIWLNAASSITYPIAFKGKERVVKITGEVYFEVAHNANKPFKVIANGQVIEDIGTSFNINAYNDEPVIRTTLLEGSIKLSNNIIGGIILKPGQQGVVSPANQSIKVQQADIEEVLAWRNGNFVFNHETIQSIMRKVSRWYDVDVVYEDGVSTDWVGGSASRFKNVSEVLRKLELTGQFHFRIDGKKIIVMK